jgi:hypothetical protein
MAHRGRGVQAPKRTRSECSCRASAVLEAVPLLSDEELTRVAAQSEKIQNDFAAGSLTSWQVTLIIAGAILLALIVAIKAA